MPGADRAINMALRVIGIGEVERDFKRVGDAGSRSFAAVEKSANGAAREVSEYHARLKRAATAAREAMANSPGLSKGTPQEIRTNRRDFMLGAIKGEQERILKGLPDLTQELGAAEAGVNGLGGSMLRMTAIGAAVGSGLAMLGQGLRTSLDAYTEHQLALDSFHAALALTGNRSKATADEIAAMALRVVDSTSQTEGAALKAAQVLATVPGITREGLEAALDVSARLADALGVDVTQTAENAAKVLTALADKDMAGLVKTTEGLNDALRANVLQLAEAGKTADAQAAYIDGLRAAAGDGPNGLTGATDRLSDAWGKLKVTIGEDIAGPATTGLNLVAAALEGVRGLAESVTGRWLMLVSALASPVTLPMGIAQIRNWRKGGKTVGYDGSMAAALANGQEVLNSAGARATVKDFEKRYGSGGGSAGGGSRRAGGGGGGGKSDAQREAERLQREAEQARKSADQVAQANTDVVDSWKQRVADIEATVGLEGAALDAVRRQQDVEAAVRRINTELIDKEVVARRAAAAAAGQQFDQAGAYREAAAMVGQQASEVRALAQRYAEAERATDDFNQRQAETRAVLDQVQTPFEALTRDVEKLVEQLRAGDISGDTFNRRMDQLAEQLAAMRYEADKSAHAWRGFGQDVGRTLQDIVFNGGSAAEILQQLIALPLDRLWQANITDPIADWIDGLTGNNQAKNVDAARAALPVAADGAAVSVTTLGSAAQAAASQLNLIALGVNDPMGQLAWTTEQAAAAQQALIPLTGQLGGAMGQVIAMLSGGGGGGGILGAVLQVAAVAVGGPGAGTLARLAPSAGAAIAANPALFASGTDQVPVGRPFFVNENGQEAFEFTSGGKLRVHSNQRVRMMMDGDGGGSTIIQNITVPERADPRRTGSSIARSTQGAIARAARKGLASPGGRR